MSQPSTRSRVGWGIVVLLVVMSTPAARNAMRSRGTPAIAIDTGDESIRVVPVAVRLERPWGLAFLPDGDILVTERVGRLRIVRRGQLDPVPIAGVPAVHAHLHGGLLDVAVHPGFDHNQLVYFTYARAGDLGATVALARGRFDGSSLREVEDVFVADAWSTTDVHYGSRIVFGRDGTLFMSVGERNERHRAQNLGDHAGTIVRIRDDGSVPDDNPFVGHGGSRPEIYSYGHRNVQGLAIHPATGVLWANEHGPQGGDEVNVVMPGQNYGWPLVSLGREYSGERVAAAWCEPGTEPPAVFWTPSIGVSGMTFYTGRRLAAWAGNLFVGALSGRHLERMLLVDTAQYGREALLSSLGRRIRDVREGPDEYLYVLTDDDSGELLRIEPAGPDDTTTGAQSSARPVAF